MLSDEIVVDRFWLRRFMALPGNRRVGQTFAIKSDYTGSKGMEDRPCENIGLAAKYVICLFLLIFCICWNSAARATDWRLLDPLTHGSTSQCIGDPKTPLCAAETYSACKFSGREELCSAVGVDYETEFALLKLTGAYGRLFILFYKLMDQFTLTQKDIPAKYPKFGGRLWQPGDVALRFAWQTCQPNKLCLEEADDPNNMIAPISCRTLDTCTEFPAFEVFQVVRNVGDHWILIADFRRADLREMIDQRK